MKKTTIYLPDELDLLLEQADRRGGTSKTELIRLSVKRRLQQAGAGRIVPRSIGAVEGELGVSAEGAKRWLREHWPSELVA